MSYLGSGQRFVQLACIPRLAAPGLGIILASCLLAACGGGEESAEQNSSTPPTTTGGNQAPTIAGNPLGSVMEGTQYSFLPTANDNDGDVLSFSVQNLPSWASFDSSNGLLGGTPGMGDVGTYSNIAISVTDGADSASLPAFGIEVVATASGAATLSWTPPTMNTDGSPLEDLAGYKIYWGTSQGSYPNSVTLNNAGLTTHVVDELTPATWFFVATAFDFQGNESQFSDVASKTIL